MKWFSFLFCLVISTSVFAQDFKPGEVMVQLKKGVELSTLLLKPVQSSLRSSAPRFQLQRTIYKPYQLYTLSYDVKDYSSDQILDYLNRLPQVEAAQLNYKANLRGTTPDDPLYEDQWHLDKINLPDVWDITTGGLTTDGDTIVVAVLDSGCSPDHEDIQPNHWVNKQEIPNDRIDNDNNGYVDDYNGINIRTQTDIQRDATHGCVVSGIIGASGDNTKGVSGINWNVKLMQVSGAEFSDEIVEAYTYVLDMKKRYLESNGAEGAFVVATNYSAGIDDAFCDEFPIWGAIYDSLGCYGIVNVAATSNRGDKNVDILGDMPTTCPSEYLIAVTSTDRTDRKLDGAAISATSIDLGAPGTEIYSTRSNNRYGESGDGTSFATPMVAGVVALLYSVPQPELTALAKDDPKAAATLVRRSILSGVSPANDLEGRTVTGGRLDAFGALLSLQENFGTQVGSLDIVTLRPNPVAFNGRLEIGIQRPDLARYDIRIYNSLGQLILVDQVEEGFATRFKSIDIPNWAAGVYFITLENAQNSVSDSFVVYY